MTIKVLLLQTGENLTVSESYGRRLIEQGRAVSDERAPEPRKSEKREKAAKQPAEQKEGE